MFWKRFKRDKSAVIGLIAVGIILFLAIFGPLFAPYNPYEQDLAKKTQPPNKDNLLGRDVFGRDVFSRILYGARTTVMAGFLVVSMALLIGTTLGVCAGYWGGLVDTIIMRSMDFLLAFPYFFLAILIVATLGPSLINAVLAITITRIPQFVRIVKGSTLGLIKMQYIEASKAMGSSDIRIMWEHIVPNLIGPIIVLGTVGIANAVLGVAALSFLGMGAQPPTAEWGLMLSEGRTFIYSHPRLSMIPGIFLALYVLSINLVGDGLRDVLDPRLK